MKMVQIDAQFIGERFFEESLTSKYQVSKKERCNVFNKPLSNSDIFNFQNLICFWLSTPKLSF